MTNFNKVYELDTHVTGWKIAVKIIRLWYQYWWNGTTIEMILSDEKGNQINASVKADDVAKFKKDLHQGAWIMIWGMNVNHETRKPRTTDNRHRIEFLSYTIVKPIEPKAEGLLLKPVRFYDVITRGIDTQYLYDFVGYVHQVGDLKEWIAEAYEEEFFVLKFYLRDAKNEIIMPCTVKGDLATEFYEEYQKHKDEFTVCVLRYWSIKYHEGCNEWFTLECCGACSEFLFNPDDKDVEEFKQEYFGRMG